jgi:fatty-acid desaturase
VWGFGVGMICCWHATNLINSLSHVVGTRRYNTPDDSRNSLLLSLLTMGEGWHNNHHRYPSSARQGFFFWEIDLTYYVLRCLSAVGLVWDLRGVPLSAYATIDQASQIAKSQAARLESSMSASNLGRTTTFATSGRAAPSIEEPAVTTENVIRKRLRSELPSSLFTRRPLQILWMLPLLTGAALATVTIICFSLPFTYNVALAVLIGNIYGSLFFLGHHLLHGSMIQNRPLQDLLMFPCTAALGLSPHLWRIWHHHAHHPFTNLAHYDPDNFGTYEMYLQRRFARGFMAIAPGNARWLRSLLYLTTFFVLQAQAVLWSKSRRPKGFCGLNRCRAALETSAIFVFWGALGLVAGPYDACFVIVIPWLTATFVVLSYGVTQHMLRPLDGPTTFDTTMSVAVPWLVDRIHWFNSHHIEHHLFPTLPSRALPAVRRAILEHYRDEFLAPPYGRALLAVLLTPRLYDRDALVDPATGRRVQLRDIEAVLRKQRGIYTLYPQATH